MMAGKNNAGGLAEREEIEQLIPWYVTGKLDDGDRRRVERYLEKHPEVRHSIEISKEEADATFASSEQFPAPGRRILDEILTRIEAAPDRQALRAATGLWQRCLHWIDELSPRTLAIAGAAAALVIAVQAASLGTLVLERSSGSIYRTATGQDAGQGKGTFALVKFNPDATAENITSYLSQSGAAIVEGPRANGLYRLRLSQIVLEPAAAAELISKLQSRADIVVFAVPTH